MILTTTVRDEKVKRLETLFKELEECLKGNPVNSSTDHEFGESAMYKGKRINENDLVEINERGLQACIKRLTTEMDIALKN